MEYRAGLGIFLKDQRTNVNDNVYMRLLLLFCDHYRGQ